jgi:hypothetical protein
VLVGSVSGVSRWLPSGFLLLWSRSRCVSLSSVRWPSRGGLVVMLFSGAGLAHRLSGACLQNRSCRSLLEESSIWQRPTWSSFEELVWIAGMAVFALAAVVEDACSGFWPGFR